MWSKRKTKDLFSTSYQQVKSRHFLESRASACAAFSLEDTFCNNKYVCVLSFLLKAFLYNWADILWYRTSLWSSKLRCPGYVPSPDLAQPQPTGKGKMLERAFMLCKHCSAAAKTSFLTKNSTMRASVGKTTSISARHNMPVQIWTKEGQDL